MFYKHSILEVNGEPVLYLYLEPTYEFSNDFYGENKQRSVYERVTNYIRNRGIVFQGKKVYLVINGIIVSSLIVNPVQQSGKQDVDQMIPMYKYVEILQDFIPNNMSIELLDDEEEDLPIQAGKFIDLKNSAGILQKYYLEDYAFGVVCTSLPLFFHKEARKAQAVLARTYALKQMENQMPVSAFNKRMLFRDESSLRSLWKDYYDAQKDEIIEMVQETRGEYLTYQGKPIDVYTHIVNHGRTESSKDSLFQNVPYLQSVNSPWDLKEFPFSESITFSYSQISKLLNQDINQDTVVQINKRSEGNRVKQIQIGKFRYRGDYLQSILSLRNTDFIVKQEPKGITFTFLSLENGLGMSQYGANGMAKEGYDYKQILSYYFPGTEIKKIS